MKKSLLASALLVGLGNAFVANSDTFTVTAGAIPDVAVGAHPTLGGTSNAFGAKIKLTPAALSTCEVIGATNAFETDIAVNLDDDVTDNTADAIGTPEAGYSLGDVFGTGCVGGGVGNGAGDYMLLVINGGIGNSVTIDIPDVVGTGFTWSPGRGTCVTTYGGTAAADTCANFAGTNQKTGVKMAELVGTELSTADIEDNSGTAKILLAGTLTFTGDPITGPVNETITVTVTYE
jgi:hypothetical protein